MKEGDRDNSPPGMPKSLGNVGDPLPSDDGNEQDDPYGEAHVGGSRLENIPQLIHWRRIHMSPPLLVNMKFHCLTLLSAGPISEPLVFRILAIWGLMYPERRKRWRP
jgi:hypothetical protein